MSIYDTLNDQQKEGVFTTEGPVLLLAGAGSGKTRVLTHRMAYLIEEKDVNPWNILAITFTNKAAREMRERVDKLVGLDAGSAWVMTFHSACIRILRRHAENIGFTSSFTIYDTDDQKTLIKEAIKKLDFDPKVYKEKNVLSHISKAKDEMLTPDQYEIKYSRELYKRNIAAIYREYQHQLLSNNAMDFDDIICKTVELFENFPTVLEYYQDRFKYIMVDEYQDTNAVQFRLISLLAGGKHHNLCVVGDDDQSIYKFRGADIKNILSFENVFPETKIIKLEQNYRSTQNILNAANSVIKNNSGRMDKTLWSENGDGAKIGYNIYMNGYEEAIGIVRDIREKVAAGRSYNDFAILYRTNAQSRALEEKLVEMNVPYRVYGGVNFYARKEIKDILAYLKTIDNGRDDLAVQRIINVPKRGIGNTSVDKIAVYSDERGINFYDALLQREDIVSLGKPARKKIEPFCELIEDFKEKAEELSIKELIRHIVNSINYRDYLLETDDQETVDDRMQNIEELISKAATFEESAEDEAPTLSRFLEEVALVADMDDMDENNDIVSVMTLHSAKGLEFPIVYLAGMEDGLFPSRMAIDSEDRTEIEEERRLCYVGITRAKQELIMSMARQRMLRGEVQIGKSSRFINEIPPIYIRQSGQESYRTERQAYSKLDEDNLEAALPWNLINGSSGNKKKTPKPAGSFSSLSDLSKGINKIADSAEGLGYGVGDRVKHIKFGEGTVKEIKSGGRDFEVTVEFDKAGIKKMYASFAKLVKIN